MCASPVFPGDMATQTGAPETGSFPGEVEDRPGGWIRPVLPLAIICCLAELSYAVVNILAIPAYISKGVGLGAHVGTIMGAFLLAEALGRPGLGALSDVFGRKPLMVAGPLMSGAASLLLLTTVNPYLLVGVRILDGLGAAAFWPAIFAAVGDATAGRNRSAGMSVLNVSYMVGLAFGPLVGGWVNSLASSPGNPSYSAAFYLSAGLFSLTALAALAFVRGGRPGQAASPPEGLIEERWTGLRPMLQAAVMVWRLLIIAFTTFLGIGMLIPVVELYALDRFGIDQKTFGSLFLVPAVLIGLLAVPLGRLGDRWGRLRSVRVGVFLCGVSLWCVPLVPSYHILAGGALIVGVGFLLAFPAWMALLTEVVGEEQRGSVLGAAGMAQGFGAILGAVLGGRLYHADGPIFGIHQHDFPIYAAAASLLLSFVLTMLFVREPARRSSPEAA